MPNKVSAKKSKAVRGKTGNAPGRRRGKGAIVPAGKVAVKAAPGAAKKRKARKIRRKKLDLRDPKVRARLKKRNLERFRQIMPGLFAAIEKHQPISKLVVLDDGQPDVVFEREYFYNKRHHEYISEQLEAYWKLPHRMTLAPMQPGQLDDTAGLFLHNIISRGDKAGTQFHVGHTSDDSYYLYVFGLGLGGHLFELVERTNCKALAIIDVSLEFLVHSLEVFDWCHLLDVIDDRRGSFNVFIENHPLMISQRVRNWLRGTNPMSVDGSTLFVHYNNPVLKAALKRLSDDRSLILTGLGYFPDEVLMIKNTHHNLYSGSERVYVRPKKSRIDTPIFVVGNGPSLDDDMDFLRANQDKAIIISSGSALRSLVVNGITPDFHMETENLGVFPLIDQVAKEHDISSICLVTSTTVDIKVPPFFDTVLYYFRGSLSPYPIFADTDLRIVMNPNPTVVNASLSLAQELGFRKIYFFGTDMGTAMGPNAHHSKHAYHYTKGAVFRPQIFKVPVPGNFGGTCMTNDDLYWTRDALEKAIREFGLGYRYFNCSNGAKIEGTLPITSDLIELDEIPGGKKPIVERIIENFPVYDREEFDKHWNDKAIQELFNAWLDRFEELAIEQKNYDDLSYLTDLMRFLNPPGGGSREAWAPALVFRGTLFQVLISIEYYLRRLAKSDRRKFEKIAREELQAVVDQVREATAKEFGTLSRDAAKKAKAAKKKGTGKRRNPARTAARV